MNYKHLIYDFDGTLSNTYPCFTETVIEMLKRRGLSADYKTVYDNLKVSVGHALKNSDFTEDYSVLRKEFHVVHDELAPKIQKLYPEAEEILRYAMAQGHKNYLYTHSGKIVKILLEQWGIADCFEDIIDSPVIPDQASSRCAQLSLRKARP